MPPDESASDTNGIEIAGLRAGLILATSPWPGIPSTVATVATERLVAALWRRTFHRWDMDMDMDKPGIDPILARQRLLDAADELFYRQGIHRVSIDRVIEKAGVPAETLREAFGSTDELVRAYLRARHTRLQDALARELPRYRTPHERLVGVFEVQGQSFVEPGFRGCALVTASAEALPGEVVEEVVTEYRDWIHNLFFDLAFAAEVTHPEELAEQLVVLFDGAAISAWLDAKPSTVNTTQAVAQALIDAALKG
jgi:AcrR family transcriptional regulator